MRKSEDANGARENITRRYKTVNWTIYGIECIGTLILFTCLIMISLCKNLVWWIHDYPKDIQEKYFETHEHMDKARWLDGNRLIEKLAQRTECREA